MMGVGREIHPQDRVAGLERGEVHALVGPAAGVRLHVGRFRAEQFLGVGKKNKAPFSILVDYGACSGSDKYALLREPLGVARKLKWAGGGPGGTSDY